ncbi:MAG: hypothetical protein ACYDAO_09735 [Thermoplasmataceae archaeon]
MKNNNFPSLSNDKIPDYSTKLTSSSLKGFNNQKKPWNRFDLNLDFQMDYDSVFKVVKESVKYVVGKERAGLGLALSDLPWNLGAFWQIGGNYIVMNEGLVNSMKKIAKSELEFNSFVYMILAHEYIHSLGFIDEMEARRMTATVALRVFGKNHIAYIMSAGNLWLQYPDLRYSPSGSGENIRIVRKFDSSATSYIA